MIADLRLRVVSAPHLPTALARTCLVQCRPLSSRAVFDGDEDVVLVLNFAHIAPQSDQLRRAKDMREGREVHLWKPWHVLKVDVPSLVSPDASLDPVDGAPALQNRCNTVLLCPRFWIM